MSTLSSTFQRGPAYRYIRETDKLPTETPDVTAEQIICKVRLFNPTGSGTWWIASWNPETEVAFGVAEIHEREIGDIWMPELVEFRGRFGLPIERDIHFKPCTMREVLDGGGR